MCKEVFVTSQTKRTLCEKYIAFPITLRHHMENLLIIHFLLKISIFLNSHFKARTSDKFFVLILIGNFFSINYLLTIIIENTKY